MCGLSLLVGTTPFARLHDLIASSATTVRSFVDRAGRKAFSNRVQDVDGSHRCIAAQHLPPPPPTPRSALDGEETGGRRGLDVDHPGAPGCDGLSTLRGYLLVSRGSLLSVYNMTEGMELLFAVSASSAAAGAMVAGDPSSDAVCGEEAMAGRWVGLPSSHHAEPLVIQDVPCVPVSLLPTNHGAPAAVSGWCWDPDEVVACIPFF